MGQSKSKHVYAFQPLPWPEALTAFRLIDQICGIASTYATTHLDKHATVVLDKVSELQRLPHLWDAFENDFERLRGTHLVRLASELHNVLDRLEGCKYDMGLMAEKDLTFKSHRKAAEKVLALLREVEEAHRAFHYAFELALYASLREHPEGVPDGEGERREEPPPESPTGAPGPGIGSGRGLVPATSSGGGTAVLGLRRALLDAAADDPTAAATAPPPPPPVVEDSWMYDVRSHASTPRRLVSPERAVAAAAAAAAIARQPVADTDGEIEPVSPRRAPPASTPKAAPSPRRPHTADASTMVRSQPPPPPPPPAPSLPRPHSPMRSSLATAQSSRRRYDTTERRSRDVGAAATAAATDQQYVVMYLPQGPDGGGPRAILVPTGALQPAPNSPGLTAAPSLTATMPSMAATTVTGGISPFATNPRAAYAALPSAAIPSAHLTMATASPRASMVVPPPPPPVPAPAWGAQYLTSPSSPALPPSPQVQYQPVQYAQQQPYQQPTAAAYSYAPSKPLASMPSPPPPPPPAVVPPPSPPLVPYRSPGASGYRQPYRASGTATAPGTSRLTPSYSGGSLGSIYGTAPYNSTATAAATIPAAPSPPYRYAAGLIPPPAPGVAASPIAGQYGIPTSPSYDPYGTGGLLHHHASRSATRSPALSMTASGTPDLHAYFDRPAGPLSGGGASGGWLSPLAAPAPAAPGGSLMMLQPVTAHTTSNGAFVLQPQAGSAAQLVMASSAGAQKQQQAGGAGVGVGGRGLSSGRVRFVGRRGLGMDEDDEDLDAELDAFGDGSGGEEDLAGGGGSGGTDGSHLTYSYGLEQRRSGRAGGRDVPSYLTPYRGSDSLEEACGLSYDTYGRRSSRRFSDGGGRGGADPLSSSRNSSGRAWGDVDGGVGAAAPVHRRTGSYNAARPSSSPPLLGTLSRDADLDSVPLSVAAAATAAARRSSPQRSGSAGQRTPSSSLLSYERLAALAGLEPDVLGGGAAAGLAAGGGGAAQPRRSHHHSNPYSDHHHQHHQQQRQPHQLVPGESSLRRAEELSEAVEGGDWGAAVELAALMRRGWWADSRDGAVARGLLLQAALRGGSADAHAALGSMAERGEGLPGGRPDLAAAARHYSAAAAGGHRDATTALAYLLEHGLGVEQDEPRATQLYAAAAQRNCPTAANNLAKMILDGRGAVGAATAAAAATGGAAGDVGGGSSPAALARALFKRAAKAGSASAWYNLGVCHLQQVKQRGGRAAAAGGGGGPGGPLAAAVRDDVEGEALRCFGEAAKRGHARAALRAGHLHLPRSAAAAAVEAFCTAALNAGAAARAPPAPAGGGSAAASGDEPAAPSGAATVEAEALWCLAQLAERQAAVLEVRTAAEPQPAAAAAAASGSLRRQLSAASDGAVSVDGDGGRRSGGSHGADGSGRGSRHSGGDDDGGAGGGGAVAAARAARPGADDDTSSTRTGGTDNRAVGQLLATLARSATVNGPDGAAAVAAAGLGVSVDDPAAAAAVTFAKEICRLDFSCCHRPAGQPPFTAANGGDAGAAAAAAAAEPIRGLRRLRRQAREVLAESDAAVAATPGSISETSSINGAAAAGGGAAASGSAMVSALARLELELQQPAERARRARRAAAELMAAAAALGHAAAQHWLAGWRWSLGQAAAAVALWEAAGRRGHGAALMVLGQMAEAGELPAAEAAEDGPVGGGGGADLAAAARYYLRAQEAGAPGAVEAMRRVQKLLQRHVTLQGKLEAVAAGGGGGGAGTGAAGRNSGGAGGLGRRP